MCNITVVTICGPCYFASAECIVHILKVVF